VGMERGGLGYKPKSEEEIAAAVEDRKREEQQKKRKEREEHSDEERSNLTRRTFAAEDFEQDAPAVVESAEIARIDPSLLIEVTKEESEREKAKFKEMKERKEKKTKVGSLKLKGLVLKGTGKEAHFKKSREKADAREKTLEELLDERVKLKYDKYASF